MVTVYPSLSSVLIHRVCREELKDSVGYDCCYFDNCLKSSVKKVVVVTKLKSISCVVQRQDDSARAHEHKPVGTFIKWYRIHYSMSWIFHRLNKNHHREQHSINTSNESNDTVNIVIDRRHDCLLLWSLRYLWINNLNIQDIRQYHSCIPSSSRIGSLQWNTSDCHWNRQVIFDWD
jgi:hypothetical protein